MKQQPDSLAQVPPQCKHPTAESEAAPVAKAVAKPALWRSILNEIEDAPGRYDVYYCPLLIDEDQT